MLVVQNVMNAATDTEQSRSERSGNTQMLISAPLKAKVESSRSNLPKPPIPNDDDEGIQDRVATKEQVKEYMTLMR